jgi:DNA adenine methylase
MNAAPLVAPFPYFGGKRRVAAEVWARFGDVENYCEPFFGSGAVLLARPHGPSRGEHRIETVNDADRFLANFWRALKHEPEAVA